MDDAELLRAAAGGDHQAMHTLYARHGVALLNYLLSHLNERQLAEEVLQAVMLAAWHGAANFRGESTVRTWLFSIARYQALRVRGRTPRTALPLDDNGIAGGVDPGQALDHKQQREALEAALAQLPIELQETLELVYYRGLTVAETAEHQHIPAGTVKSRLHRARAVLRKLLTKENDHA